MSQLRGHPIELRGRQHVFVDTGEPVQSTWQTRPCGHCGDYDTPEGHDACLGTLPGVINACCGHGVDQDAYAQFPDGTRLSGSDALRFFSTTKGGDA